MHKLFLIQFAVGLYFVFGGAQFAQADIDVTCVEDDCLTYGWDAYDSWNRDLSSVSCKDFDCENSGWANVYKGITQSEILCKQNGCFNQGWVAYDSRSGRVTADVTCFRSRDGETQDCLNFGWSIFQPGYGTSTISCIAGDCRSEGWSTRYPNGAIQSTRCKLGGCFNQGWVVYR